MDVVKVLGSEKCYLMTDGSKVPFSERDTIFGTKGKIAEANKITIVKPTPKAVRKFGRSKGK
jgi:hypothetical protein